MIQITRLLAKQLVSVIKKGLNRSKPAPIVTVRSGDEGLLVEAQAPNYAAVRYHDPRSQDRDLMLIPLSLLEDVQGPKSEQVFLTRPRKGVLAASWDDKGVCREMEYDEQEQIPDPQPFPELPTRFRENPPELLTALRDAYETTDVGSVRYALNCIQLRTDGVIGATDGRQLLKQSGFQFPFDSHVLVQNTRFFSCKELPTDQSVQIGKTETDVVVRFGPWTYWVGIQKEGRFPDVDMAIPPEHNAKCTLHLAQQDSRFLLDNMHRMPTGDTHRELTLDLNGSVILRASSASTPRPAEIILRNSSKSGDDVRICTDRNYLVRAAQMGFLKFHLPNDTAPAFARDDKRTYLWMMLENKDAIKPSDDCLRFESPISSSSYRSTSTTRKATPVNRIAATINQTQPAAHQAAQPVPAQPPTAQQPPAVNEPVVRRRRTGNGKTASALEQAIVIRDQLRDTLTRSKELIRSLKTEKRSQKSLKLALDSLKQLQKVA